MTKKILSFLFLMNFDPVIIRIGRRRREESLPQEYGKREIYGERERGREGKGMSHVWWLSFRMSNQEGTWVEWCRRGKWT